MGSLNGLHSWVWIYFESGPLTDLRVKHIVPLLPPHPHPSPPFSVRRLRLTIRRLYLAFFHLYKPFITRAIALVSWKEPKITLKYCLVSVNPSLSATTQCLYP